MSAVEQRHMDFARAVVKLAREHKMDGLVLQFRDSFSARRADAYGHEQMHMAWSEGRHGGTSRISIRCDATTSFDEAAPTPHGVSVPGAQVNHPHTPESS